MRRGIPILLAWTLPALALLSRGEPSRVGTTLDLGSRRATITRLDDLPLVDSEYSRRYRFDRFDNPRLAPLRERYRLEEVVAPGRDEFERQVMLLDWSHRQFTRFGRPTSEARGAWEVLAALAEGHTFFCAQFTEVFVSAAASLGWISRPLALRRHQGVNRVGGSTEHSVTEIWSNQYRKWVMFDPTSNLHVTRGGIPLNAVELRQEWFHRAGSNLVFVVGREQRHYGKAELPIVLGSYPGFGELAVHPDEFDKYGFIGFIPNTDLMDHGYDYGGMFIVQDELCAGTSWHKRKVPEHPLVDPYFPINQAAVGLRANDSGDAIRVELRTLTPNLDRFEIRHGEGAWSASPADFDWAVVPGTNRLSARTINRFGVSGAASELEVMVVATEANDATR